MSKTLLTMKTELQSFLAEDGAANDYWKDADLTNYINQGIRMVASEGRMEVIRGLSLSGNAPTSPPVVISDGEYEYAAIADGYIRMIDPAMIYVADGTEKYFAELTTPEELKLFFANGIDYLAENPLVWVNGKNIYVTGYSGSVDSIYYEYIGEPTDLTSDGSISQLSDVGDDYAIKYAQGCAYLKGGYNTGEGIALQEAAKKECK